MASVVICSSYFRCAAWAVAAMRWHDAADGQRTNNVPFAAIFKVREVVTIHHIRGCRMSVKLASLQALRNTPYHIECFQGTVCAY